MKQHLRRFVFELFAPPKWVREAEASIAVVRRRRQCLIRQLESYLGRCS